jgi:hypothetical protein
MTPPQSGPDEGTNARPAFITRTEPFTETNDGSAQFQQKKQKLHPRRPWRVSSLPSVRDFDQRA